MSAITSRQLTPEEMIEAVSRVAGHVPVAVVADHLGVSPQVVVDAVARAKANRAARGVPVAPQVEATPNARNGRGPDVAPASAPTPPPRESAPTRTAALKSVDAADLATIEDLCKWADGAGVNRAVMLAERVRVASEELRSMLRRRDEIDVRRVKVVEAEQVLAQARAELAEITGSKKDLRSPRSGPVIGASTAEIRAWAVKNGYDVQPRGLPSHTVIGAYHAAHAAADAP